MVDDDSQAADAEVLIKEVRELRNEVANLRGELAELRGEVRRNRAERDERIDDVKTHIANVEGCLDVTKTFPITGKSAPSIRAAYRDIDRAVKRANRTGKETRVDIPDGEHPIIARIRPGTDAATVICNIYSAS